MVCCVRKKESRPSQTVPIPSVVGYNGLTICEKKDKSAGHRSTPAKRGEGCFKGIITSLRWSLMSRLIFQPGRKGAPQRIGASGRGSGYRGPGVETLLRQIGQQGSGSSSGTEGYSFRTRNVDRGATRLTITCGFP